MSEPFDLGLGNADAIAARAVRTIYDLALTMNAPMKRLVRGRHEFTLSQMSARDLTVVSAWARELADDADKVIAAQNGPKLMAAE